MEQIVYRIQAIKVKVQALQQEQMQLQSELSQRNKDVERLKRLIDIQNSTIKQLEQKLKTKRIADGVQSDEPSNNRDLKFKINEMIGEIDKIIALLHQ